VRGISLNKKNMINIITRNMELETFLLCLSKIKNVLITAFT
jgi:hypothetical protein